VAEPCLGETYGGFFVALLAGLLQVVWIDRGKRIVRRPDVVNAMAIEADGLVAG